MRRVRKEKITPQAAQEINGYALCLECWKQYMQLDDRDLSASRMMLAGGADREQAIAYESDPYEQQRLEDRKTGAAVAAVIDDLKPLMRWAIYRKCGIATLWRYPHADYLQVLIAADAELESRLRRHPATAIFF